MEVILVFPVTYKIIGHALILTGYTQIHFQILQVVYLYLYLIRTLLMYRPIILYNYVKKPAICDNTKSPC